MVIKFNVTGAQRKALVSAVCEELKVPVKYLGAPTFAYEVGGYHIDKNGTLQGDDNPGLIADLQGLHGFTAISEVYDTPLPEAKPVPDDVMIPGEAALGGRVSPYRDYEEPPAYGIPKTGEIDRLTIEMPKSALTDTAFENLKRLVASKETLIKKALGAEELPITVSDDTIKFPWFHFEKESETVKAYTHFVTAICDMAKTKKRINATEIPVDNEKYSFRCFLLRLGFIGEEYKAERKILLKNLSGSSAYRNGGILNGR